MSLFLAGMMANRNSQAAGAAAAAKSTANSAATGVDIAARRIEALEERVDRLTLLTLALGEALKRKTGATDEEILKQVSLLDLMDGVPDGKLTRTAKKCAGCGRVIAARNKKCLFCGGDRLDPVDAGTLESLVL